MKDSSLELRYRNGEVYSRPVEALDYDFNLSKLERVMSGAGKKVFEASYAQIHEALRALVKRAVKSGEIRKDLDPIDLLRAIVGVANVSTSPDWQQSARRLVDILIAGSQPLK
jgi:hypothetical protein